MDYKDFKDGLLSLGMVVFLFSLTLMMGSIVLKPYMALELNDLNFIVILCLINIIFCVYYIAEALRLEKVFKLEDKHIIKFGKRIGIMTGIYSPHFIFLISLFFLPLNELEIMMIGLIFLMEAMLIGIGFKESYDLVFAEESDRKAELEMNRTRYIEKEKKPLPGE